MAKRKGGRRRKKGRKTPTDALKKVRNFTAPKNTDIWKLQDMVRGRGYFARAVASNRLATTAPPAVLSK